MPPAHRALASGPLPSLKHSSSAPNPGVQWTRVAPLRSPLTPDVRLQPKATSIHTQLRSFNRSFVSHLARPLTLRARIVLGLAFALAALACRRPSHAVPVRPTSVPADAQWAPSQPGGAWFDCKRASKEPWGVMFECAVYQHPSGQLWVKGGFFVHGANGRFDGQPSCRVFDGVNIRLDGTHMYLAPHGHVGVRRSDGTMPLTLYWLGKPASWPEPTPEQP